MKRSSNGIPVGMVQRWTRPPVSCKSCRSGKRRCNRIHPCSNCALRGIECEYEKKDKEALAGAPATATVITSAGAASPQAGIQQSLPPLPLSSPAFTIDIATTATTRWAPMELHVPAVLRNQGLQSDSKAISKHLPTKDQGMELLEHFIHCVQPTFAVLHVPSTRALVEQTYQALLGGPEEPESVNLLLLFSIFASAALTWTSQLLEKVGATPAIAQDAFATYSGLAISISESVSPSTVALEAICVLVHVLTNAEGFGEQVHQLRNRAFLMARIMQIHRLDTSQSRELRRVQEDCNMIQVEQQRRIWWHMVANDWLLAFSGGAQEGTYIFHPQHMNVNYPCNIDDCITTTTRERQQQRQQEQLFNFPASTATSMSYFLHRLYLADLCREVIDTLPSTLLEPQKLDYNVLLMLDVKFQDLIESLPIFFQRRPENIQKSRELCRERPYIAWQRTSLHFSINTYICRLHRPFHVEGTTNPKYEFSRMRCVESAHAVLDLWRSMADLGGGVGLNPARFWTLAQHVFLAAITLAAEVSLDPTAPLAEARRSEVLATCRLLEDLQHESPMARYRIQQGVQTLLSTLQRNQQQRQRRSQNTGLEMNGNAALLYDGPSDMPPTGDQTPAQPSESSGSGNSSHGATRTPFVFTGNSTACSGASFTSETMEDWGQLSTDFSDTVPGWNTPQWNSLWEDIDWTLGPGL
ncbi:hypothetical protein DL764_004657 [Monosporascus ibericus]|uniref:Zn(2)-C6 fungal-type domain-containing protein n=1 Tax=Monosporascus ibericus TaxID=155417 RepID=A0A4Q4TF34_9PEZI|nr:hypothetical protein DL764_004657 [Monosporascus ibericus]